MIDRESWERCSALLDQALELDATGRARWLQQLQQDDPATAAVLDRLLARLQPAAAASTPVTAFGDLLDRALDDQQDAPAATPGQHFGPWQVSRKLGSGGMGEVWMATRADRLYEGHAAIKLLAGGGDLLRLNARFARERNLLARLNHPGIARLLDAGTSDGQPYLVLEYVEGQSLLEYAREHAPTVAARLQLGLAIARAVEYAHSRLIVHRDLKPSNVMVTLAGEVKLLDFGIAALTEDAPEETTALTRLYGRGLTLDYAAPEQITGEPTGVGSDVFSLAAMLYELLTGQRPFRGERPGRTALEHAVLHNEAPRLSRAITQAVTGHEPAGAKPQDGHRLRGDLESVIAKALRKAPEARYPTMAAFIADLENWLEHRPVSAGPDDWRYRSRLWLRRNRTIALLSAAALISLGAGLTLSLLQLQRALAAEARAGIAAEEAKRSAEHAELRREFAFGLLEAGNVGATGASAATEISLQMLDLAAARIDKSFDGQPFLRAQMRGEIAALYSNRGLHHRALTLRQEALALYRQAGAEPGYLIRGLSDLANTQHELGEFAEAEKNLRAAVALGPPPAADALDSEHPYAQALRLLGDLLKERGQYQAALEQLQQALLYYRRSEGIGGENYLNTQGSLSQAYRSMERFEEALALSREIRKLHEAGKIGQPWELALDLVFEGRSLLALGRFDEAARTFDRSYEAFKKTLGPDHPHSNYLLTFRGDARMQDGRYSEAEVLLRDSLRRRLAEPEGGALTFNTRWRLALNALYRGDYAEAEAQAREHLKAEIDYAEGDELKAGLGFEVLGEVLLARDQVKQAVAVLRKAVAAAESALSPPSLAIGRSQTLLASALSLSDQHEEALRTAASAVDNLRRKMGENHFLTAKALTAQGKAQLRAGDAEAALNTLQSAVASARSAYRARHPGIADALSAQGDALLALGRKAEALPLLREASAIVAATPEIDPRHIARAAQRLAAAP